MNAPLKVTPRVRLLTMRHETSGALRQVEYLGLLGVPLRVLVHWPLAGEYTVSPVTGRLLADPPHSRQRRPWRLVDADRVFITLERQLEQARRHFADKDPA